VALELTAIGTEERYLRSAVNRAYYACFHLARLGCERKWSWVPAEYGQHRAVIRELREHRQTFLAGRLSRLLNLREHADYDLARPVDRELSRQALALADELMPRLQTR
jgi:uncharacterized protein (UPF0332 family)